MSLDIDVAENLQHALELLSPGDPQARPVAGATDVILRLHAGRLSAKRLVSLTDVRELNHVHADAGSLRMGAATPLTDLMRWGEFQRELPGALAAAREFASPQIRNRATLGGNIGNASPAADMVPSLITAGAELTLAAKGQQRTLPLEELFLGFGKTALNPNELITEIRVPRQPGTFQAYAKFGSRSANVIAVVNMAMCLTLSGERIQKARVAYGSVAPKPYRARKVETLLEGQDLSERLISDVEDVLRAEVSPIDDVRGSRRYKLRLAINATQDALSRALRQTREVRP